MSDEKKQIILDDLKDYLKVRIIEEGLSGECKGVLLTLLIKIVEMEAK